MSFVEVAVTGTESLIYAIELEITDFEDAMQVAAAVACRADVIATRNLRDFRRSPIPARLPASILEELQSD